MKRIILALIGVALAPLAYAQTCDVELTAATTYGGKPFAKAGGTYYGLDAADVATVHEKAVKIVDVAANQQNQGGRYVVALAEWRTCDGKKADAAATEIEAVNLDAHGFNKTNDQLLKALNELQKIAKDRAKKGNKKVWGKE